MRGPVAHFNSTQQLQEYLLELHHTQLKPVASCLKLHLCEPQLTKITEVSIPGIDITVIIDVLTLIQYSKNVSKNLNFISTLSKLHSFFNNSSCLTPINLVN